ncbi:hypothetical protein GLOIN_2v1791191 [Rhizophagus irregularis DAOM 181602=DAOM 197198]|nr:hypothetical protein GLOIN_2v1791191 [Rhizophagus irregularis DAOM 181602=DAOM 197198]
MPAQLSTILYISEYKEMPGEFFIGMATGYTRFEEKPFYVSKLEEGQVLSITNSKFGIGLVYNQIDLILTSATILPIKPEDLPIHQINVVGKL